MISRKSEDVLNKAGRYAFERRHEYCTLEHVFWALLEDPKVRETVEACGVKPARLKRELEEYLEREMPRAPDADGLSCA